MRLFSLFLLTILSTTVLINAVKAAADADIRRSLRIQHRNNSNDKSNNIRRIQDESSNFEDRTPAPEPITEDEKEEETVDETNNDERNDDGEDTSALDSNTSVEAEGENESEGTNQGNGDGDDTSALDSNSSAEKEEDEQESDEIGAPVESPVSSPVESESSFDSPVESPVSSPDESESVDSPVDAPVSSPVESESVDSPVDAPVSSPVESESVDSPVDAPASSPVESESVDSPVDAPVSSPVDSSFDSPVDSPVSTSTETPTYNPTRYKEPSSPSLEYEPPTAGPMAPTQRPTRTYTSSDDDPLKNDVLDEADSMDSSSSEEWGWNDSTVEEIEQKIEEMEHDKAVIIALSVVFGVMFFFSIFVAYQMLENPEGCCARLVIMLCYAMLYIWVILNLCVCEYYKTIHFQYNVYLTLFPFFPTLIIVSVGSQ